MQASHGGIIERMGDVDFHGFNVSVLSDVTIAVDVAAVGPNLDARLELSTSYTVTTSTGLQSNASYPVWIGGDTGLSDSYSGRLEPGRYYLVVASQGEYGDLGQYTARLTVEPTTPIGFDSGVLSLVGTSDDDRAELTIDSSNQAVATLSATMPAARC